MAELGAVNPRKCRFFFRKPLEIYTAASKQDNFAVVDKVIKQFDEQIIMSTDKSFLLFCQSGGVGDCASGWCSAAAGVCIGVGPSLEASPMRT